MPDFGFDDWIDAQLRNVPLPPNLLARLAESGPGPSKLDAEIDAALCDVPVPPHLESRLRRITRRNGPPFWRKFGLAASVLVMIGLGATAYVSFLAGTVGPGPRQTARRDADANPTSAQTTTTDAASRRPTPADLAAQRAAARRRSATPVVPVADGPVSGDPASGDESGEAALPGLSDVAAIGSAVREAIDAKLREQAALGANGTLDRLPDLETFEPALAWGVAPPRVRGYDLLFELKHGEHPFVVPSADASLATNDLPFAFRTASFDRALDQVRSGNLPAANEIRIEDFLAAQDYTLPPAPRAGLALHTAGSVSPLESKDPAHKDLRLLHFAVQSAAPDPRHHHPNRLIVALDSSAQMRGQARLDATRRALTKLIAHLGENDRVTLIRFAEQPAVLAEEASREQLATLMADGGLPAPGGAANLSAAIAEVCRRAREANDGAARQVVVITADRGNFDPQALPQASEALRQVADMNLSWRIIRLAAEGNDAHWSDLAEQARGKIQAASSGDQIFAGLHEALVGQPVVAAKSVAVKLKFNPQVVAAYRLLGHEATTLTAGENTPIVIDLEDYQVATTLYELSLKPGVTEPVATVDLTWRHPPTDQSLRIARPILRKHLAGSFSQAPAWHQEAVIAAKAAEALRGSQYSATARPIAQVLELAGQVPESLAQESDFRQLVGLLKGAEKAR
jgi:Ca-activated chloride channel family protein